MDTLLVTRAAQKAGWRGLDLLMAVAVHLGETDGKDRAHFYNPKTGDDSLGPWMVNTLGDLWPELQKRYHLTSKEQLYDLDLNARIAHDKWLDRGWQPWGAWKRDRIYLYGRWEKARRTLTDFALRGEALAWSLAPCISAMRHEADTLAPRRSKASDGTIGDSAHAGTKSEHNPDSRGIVHAIDLTHDPAGGWDCHKRVAEIIAKKDRRILYVIFDHTMYRSYDKPGIPAWSPGREKDWGHPHHMHVSVKSGETYENDVSPWFGEEDELTDEDLKKIQKIVKDTVKDTVIRALGVALTGEDNSIYKWPENWGNKPAQVKATKHFQDD